MYSAWSDSKKVKARHKVNFVIWDLVAAVMSSQNKRCLILIDLSHFLYIISQTLINYITHWAWEPKATTTISLDLILSVTCSVQFPSESQYLTSILFHIAHPPASWPTFSDIGHIKTLKEALSSPVHASCSSKPTVLQGLNYVIIFLSLLPATLVLYPSVDFVSLYTSNHHFMSLVSPLFTHCEKLIYIIIISCPNIKPFSELLILFKIIELLPKAILHFFFTLGKRKKRKFRFFFV